MLTRRRPRGGERIAQGVGLPIIKRVADLKAASASADAQKGGAAKDLLEGVDGFAEVYPEDKYTVVKHLQAAGHVTGMTGDGVNDAPALRQAEVGIAVSSATDVAKGAASVVLTEPGLTNIVTLVEQGRIIYQRVLTWIVNKISRTILKSSFVAIAFILTGKFVVSAFAMLLLVFMTDFAKISLATDHVRPSKKPETWNIGGLVSVSVVLGLAMVIETLLFLAFGWTRFGLSTNDNALFTFSFLTLLYFAAFSIVSARERRWFWSSKPSATLAAAVAAEIIIGTVLTRLNLPRAHAFAMEYNALYIRLCGCFLSSFQRRPEGCPHEVAHAAPRRGFPRKGTLKQPMRILVVEDEKGIVDFLVQGLKEANYSVDVASDGQAGLDDALCAPYDVVLLDVMLPKMNGFFGREGNAQGRDQDSGHHAHGEGYRGRQDPRPRRRRG